MALLFKDDYNFRWQPSVMELKDHITLAGKIYDKTSLAPVPFRTLYINSFIKSSLIGKINWLYDSSGINEGSFSAIMDGGLGVANSFVMDNSEANVGYILCHRDSSNGTTLYAHKINTLSNTIIASGNTNLGGSEDVYAPGYYDHTGCAFFIDQDATHLYFIHKHAGKRRSNYNFWTDSGYCVIGWINKNSMTMDGEAGPFYHANISYLGKSGTTLYIGCSRAYALYTYTAMNGPNAMYITKFNMATKTATTILTQSISETFKTYGCLSRPFSAPNNILYGYWAARSDNPSEGYRIYKYEINALNETATSEECTYDFGSTDRATTLVRHDDNAYTHKVITFSMDDSINKYACFVVTETPTFNAITQSAFRLHVFKINPNDRRNLIYKSTITPGYRIRGIMPLLLDYTKILLIGDSICEVWTWNSSTETYVYTSNVAISCRGAMLDSLNRLWLTDASDNIHLVSNFSPITITVTPASASYNYQGTVINSYILVSAYNMDNTRVAVPVRLVLEGSTYFTDDSQVKQITTSASGETQVNIKITGASFSRVLASVVV